MEFFKEKLAAPLAMFIFTATCSGIWLLVMNTSNLNTQFKIMGTTIQSASKTIERVTDRVESHDRELIRQEIKIEEMEKDIDELKNKPL